MQVGAALEPVDFDSDSGSRRALPRAPAAAADVASGKGEPLRARPKECRPNRAGSSFRTARQAGARELSGRTLLAPAALEFIRMNESGCF
jgi:hypothetical protein